MTYRIKKKKWILYRHTNNFNLITAVAINLKSFLKTSISKDDKLKLLLKLKSLDYYKERNAELPLDSINHRINTLAYYMFGYKDKIDGKDKFLFSPLGNLFLNHVGDTEKISKIFLTMLWAIQFEHPHGGSDKIFNLYPFRLLFKLLTDSRIEKKLYAYEVSYLLVFIKNIDDESYENLIKEILELRKWPNEKLASEFKLNEHVYVNSAYEWDYYVSKLLEGAGVIKKVKGEDICKLVQGKGTLRRITKNSVVINPNLYEFCLKLLNLYPFDEKPLNLDDPERLKIDVIKEIYGFYPKVLLQEIGEKDDDIKYELLNLPKLIEKYSNNNMGEESSLFEDILVDGFNMFHNIEAKRIGGPGNTDIECLYFTKKKKFAVDAKSTKNKLHSLSSGRLASHREKIGGRYTIVVTPRYVPAVLYDIKSAPIVIIRASTFSEYLYNNIDNNVRKIDYSDFDDIIEKNLGTDISEKISDLTINKFAIQSPL